jgi:poly(beta-D-mannuronate) lyase
LNGVESPAVDRGFVNTAITLEAAANGLKFPADENLAGIGASRDLEVLDVSSTGVDWYEKPARGDRFDSGAQTQVSPGEGALAAAVQNASAGDVISLAPGDYRVAKILMIDKPLTIRAASADQRASIEFERTALFEIADGGSLELEGLDISGRSAPDMAGNSLIRTSRYSMLGNYELVVRDTAISDLDTNHSFNFFTVSKHTFARRIEISGSSFENITGHVLFMNRETDDLGIYNGEYVSISASTFRDIEGSVADVYRGGTDESTFGPHFEFQGSTVENVGHGKRNKARASIRLLGVQATDIRDNAFTESQPVRVIHTVGEPVTRFADNQFSSTPAPIVADIGDL